MYCVKKMTEDLYWVGGNDRRLALFENMGNGCRRAGCKLQPC